MLYGCWLLDSDGCDLEGLKKRHLEYVEAAVQYFFDRFDSEIEVDDEQLDHFSLRTDAQK